MPTPYWEALFNAMYVETPQQAEQTLEKLIAWAQKEDPSLDYEKARSIQLSNIGWFFGEVSPETRTHAMEMWPEATHPIFGRHFSARPDQVLQAGMAVGAAMREGKTIQEATQAGREELEDRGTPQLP